jgi:hypothetical protein
MLWECATAPNLMTEAICQLVILVTKHGWNWFKIPLNEVANGNTSQCRDRNTSGFRIKAH